MRLLHNGTVVVSELEVASSFAQRSKGLLGRASLPENQGLWIKRCNSIHTWFMRFAIDAVFVDSSLHVIHVYRNLPPWRVTLPRLKATSVIEVAAGTLPLTLNPGDQLYVES
ncbi:MAG: DUF192 domain-containing protein [Bdellovibrionaceae bacterium]|nr:DUF192 domain-containing protein [Pseudobdellovibrionaceae bacterium]